MKRPHTTKFVEKIIKDNNLTMRDVVVHYYEKYGRNREYYEIVQELRLCDADTIRWILSTGKYSQ